MFGEGWIHREISVIEVRILKYSAQHKLAADPRQELPRFAIIPYTETGSSRDAPLVSKTRGFKEQLEPALSTSLPSAGQAGGGARGQGGSGAPLPRIERGAGFGLPSALGGFRKHWEA